MPEDAWTSWAFDDDFPVARMKQGSATGAGLDDWCILYHYSSARNSWPAGQQTDHGITTRQEEFWFEMMIGLPKGKAATMAASWKKKQIDFHDWLPESRTDRGYLYELGRRSTWDEGRNGPERGNFGETVRFRQFTVGYHWESHLDRTMPGGLAFQVPSSWLIETLRLSQKPERPGVFVDDAGRVVMICERGRRGVLCAARRRETDSLLAREGLEPTWIGIGERSTYPRQGSGAEFHRRRWNGTFIPSKRNAPAEFWTDDVRHAK